LGSPTTNVDKAKLIYSAKFGPTGKQVVTASADKAATIWDAESSTVVRKLGPHHQCGLQQERRTILARSERHKDFLGPLPVDLLLQSRTAPVKVSNAGPSATGRQAPGPASESLHGS
jgi:WD40 repeat protein